jgi:hypothetical protein
VDPLADACAFIEAHLPNVREWPEGRLAAWWTWHWQRRLAAVIVARERVVAVGCVRVVDTHRPEMLLGEGADYAHDPAGNCIYIGGVAVAEGYREELLPRLWQMLEASVGPRQYVAFQRTKYRGRIRIHPFNTFSRIIRAGRPETVGIQT